jgi:hypothetical protein
LSATKSIVQPVIDAAVRYNLIDASFPATGIYSQDP